MTLYGTPGWANGGRGENWAPASGSTFASFAAAIAMRYPFVHLWAIWNEPNQARWLRPTSPAVYTARLLNPAYAAIHHASPASQVAGGVTAPRGSTGGVSPMAWAAGMAAAHARLDAYAHNPYPLQPHETPLAGGCDHCSTVTMATAGKLIALVHRDFGARTRIGSPSTATRRTRPTSCSASRTQSRRRTSPRRRCARTSCRASTSSSST